MSKLSLKLWMGKGTIDNAGDWVPPDNNRQWQRGFERRDIFISLSATRQIGFLIRSHLPQYRYEHEDFGIPDPLAPPDFPGWDEIEKLLQEWVIQRNLEDLDLILPAAWTVPSDWGYVYVGMNQNGWMLNNAGNRPERENGLIRVEPDTDNEFKIHPQGGIKITDVWVQDSAAQPHYTVSTQGVNWIVTQAAHTDLPGEEDYIYVIANGGGNGDPDVLCDPIVYNRR